MSSYCIVAHLTTQSGYRLEIAASSAHPLSCLWTALFRFGPDLRESTSYIPELDEVETIQKEREWQSFEAWRKTLGILEDLEDLELKEDLELEEELELEEDLELEEIG